MYYNIEYEYHMDSFTNNYVYFLMRLLIAGEGSRDRVWGPVFTRGPVQFRQQQKIKKIKLHTESCTCTTETYCTKF